MDVGQVIATGSTAIIGIVIGAALTYWFGALNRQHQEEREDKTRWYEARLRPYVELIGEAFEAHDPVVLQKGTQERTREFVKTTQRLASIQAHISLVGSPLAVVAAQRLMNAVLGEIRDATMETYNKDKVNAAAAVFVKEARRDLGFTTRPSARKQSAELRSPSLHGTSAQSSQAEGRTGQPE